LPSSLVCSPSQQNIADGSHRNAVSKGIRRAGLPYRTPAPRRVTECDHRGRTARAPERLSRMGGVHLLAARADQTTPSPAPVRRHEPERSLMRQPGAGTGEPDSWFSTGTRRTRPAGGPWGEAATSGRAILPARTRQLTSQACRRDSFTVHERISSRRLRKLGTGSIALSVGLGLLSGGLGTPQAASAAPAVAAVTPAVAFPPAVAPVAATSVKVAQGQAIPVRGGRP
jgi:hypothetical protein